MGAVRPWSGAAVVGGVFCWGLLAGCSSGVGPVAGAASTAAQSDVAVSPSRAGANRAPSSPPMAGSSSPGQTSSTAASGPFLPNEPSALTDAGLGYDPRSRRVMAFGGDRITTQGETTTRGVGSPTYAWSLRPGWQLLHPIGRVPSGRTGALLADSRGSLLMVDGVVNVSTTTPCPSPSTSLSPDGTVTTTGCKYTGTLGGNQTPGDAWTWQGSTWTRTPTTGLPATGQTLTDAPALGGVVLVGDTARGNVADPSRDVLGTWLMPDTGPPVWHLLSRTHPETGHIAYDAVSHQLLAYSGNTPFKAGPGIGAPDRPGASTTSVLRGGRWVALWGAAAEDADGAIATDPTTGHLMLITELGHTFTWTGNHWQRRAVASPTDRTGLPELTTDPADHLVMAVYFHNRGATTWTYDGHWHLAPGPTP